MPLPFMKKKDQASVSLPADTIERTPDEPTDFDGLDAIAEDVMSAVKAGDRAMLKAALQSLVTHIQSEDMEQDAMSGEQS